LLEKTPAASECHYEMAEFACHCGRSMTTKQHQSNEHPITAIGSTEGPIAFLIDHEVPGKVIRGV
jgi:hypothetical protein